MKKTLLAAAGLLLSAMAALAADTIVFGAAISITGKTAKEGEYTRDGYQFAIDKINELGGIKVGGKTYKVELQVLRRRDQARAHRAADREAHQRGQGQLHPRPLRLLAHGHRRADLRALQDPDGRGQRLGRGDLLEGLQVHVHDPLAREESTCAGSSTRSSRRTRRRRRVAILGENEAFSKEVAQGAAEYAKEKGMTVVYDELYPTNAQDVSALLTAIKGKNPDIILGSGHLQDSLLIVKQAKDLGVNPEGDGLLGRALLAGIPREPRKGNADYIFGATQWTEALQYNGDDPWKTPEGVRRRVPGEARRITRSFPTRSRSPRSPSSRTRRRSRRRERSSRRRSATPSPPST